MISRLALGARAAIIRSSMGSTRTTLRAAFSVGVLILASRAGDARADEAPAGAPAPGAGVSGTQKTQPTGINEDAKKHFAAGVALLQDPEGEKVEDAYREFRTAYDMSSSPKILGNMGFCAMRLERDGEAIEAYSRYLREVPDIDADERAQIVRDLQTLSVGLSRLSIEVDKPGARIIDVRIPVRGERVTNTYGPVTGKLELGVRPGHHVITARLPDHDDATWEVDVFAGSKDKTALVMKPKVVAAAPGRSEGGGNVAPWIMIGVGGAMILGGAVTGIVALGKTSDIADKCPGDVCPRNVDLESDRSDAKTFVRITDVLLIGGGIVTAGGLGWLLLSRNGEKEPPKAAAAAAGSKFSIPLPVAGCGPDGCRASMKVVF